MSVEVGKFTLGSLLTTNHAPKLLPRTISFVRATSTLGGFNPPHGKYKSLNPGAGVRSGHGTSRQGIGMTALACPALYA